MDPQKNDTPQATPSAEGEATTNSETNVPFDPNAVGSPAVDTTVTTPSDAAADNAVSFTTDSDGTIQSAPTPTSPDGISVPEPGREGSPVPEGQVPGSSVNPEASTPDSFSVPAPNATFDAPVAASTDAPAPIDGVQPAPLDPADPASIPAAAPVPVPHKDKKTLIILVIVAVILLAAIAAMLVL